MKRILWPMMLAAAVLWLAGCARSEPEPRPAVPAAEPAAESQQPAESGQTATGQEPGTVEGATGQQADSSEPATEAQPGQASGRRVVGAVGKAVLKSLAGGSQEDLQSAPPFKP